MIQGTKLKSQYVLIKKIGSGNFSEVWLCSDSLRTEKLAIKIFDDLKLKKQPKVLQLMSSEINVLKLCNSQNVVRFFDSFQENGTYCIVMEYCNGGTLEDYIFSQPDQRISEEEAMIFMKQILNGFKELHRNKVIHRDFKLENVLINDKTLKIADLGFCTQAEMTQTTLGTRGYMAPEMMKYQKYNNKVDIWSLGVCLYRMVFRDFPFEGNSAFELLKNIEMKPINFNVKGVQKSEALVDLLTKMLTNNPANRIDWKELFSHEAFEKKQKDFVVIGSLLRPMKKEEIQIESNDIAFKKNLSVYETELMERPFEFEKNQNESDLKEERKEEDLDERKNSELSFAKPMMNKEYQIRCSQQDEVEKFMKDIDRLKEEVEKIHNRYLFNRNIISFHAKILNDLIIFNLCKNGASHIQLHFQIVFAYKILILSQIFFENLQKRINFFKLEEKSFEKFKSSEHYKQLLTIFTEEVSMYNDYFNGMLEEATSSAQAHIKNIETEDNKKERLQKTGEILKQIIAEYLLSEVRSEKNMLIHFIEILDACGFKEAFPFDDKVDGGFNFIEYETVLKEKDVISLDKMRDEKFNFFLDN